MSDKGEKVVDGMIELAGGQARTIMMELGEDVVPMWVLCSIDKEIHIIPTPWADEAEKEFARMAIKLFIKMHRVVAYSFVTEAWAATVTQAEWFNPLGTVVPSQRVDRQEVVIACAAAVGESTKFARWAIERNDDGKVTGLIAEGEITNQCESWIGEMLK